MLKAALCGIYPLRKRCDVLQFHLNGKAAHWRLRECANLASGAVSFNYWLYIIPTHRISVRYVARSNRSFLFGADFT